MVLLLAALYLRFGGLWWMQGVFYGIGAAVIAILARSAYKLVRMTVGTDSLLLCIFALAAGVTAFTESEVVWVFVLGGLLALLVRAPPHFRSAGSQQAMTPTMIWFVSGLQGPASATTLWTILLYFAEAGAFVFGSGLAIVPFLHQGVVDRFGWLSERQFLDAVAVAMITPGPVIITAGFIGYLVAGPAGATLASAGVFLPPYLLVIAVAPFFRRIAQNRRIKIFVQGVTAAATGAITGAAFVLGKHAIVDVPTILIAVGTLAGLLASKRIPEPILIVAAGIAGLVLTAYPA
jgi:chromate transporter